MLYIDQDDLPQRRQPVIRLTQNRTPESMTISIRHKPWGKMAPAQRCDVLAAAAAAYRQLADQADNERLEIAQEELSA